MSEADKFMLGKSNSMTLEQYTTILTELSNESSNIESISATQFDKLIPVACKKFVNYNKLSSNLGKFKYIFTSLTDKQLNKLIKDIRSILVSLT